MTILMKIGDIQVRPLCENDYPALYKWRNESDFLSLFSARRSVVNYEKFVREQKQDLEKNRHLQFVGESRGKNVLIGTIYSYNLNVIDGHVFIGGYLDKEFRRTGYGAISCAFLITYLFKYFPLYKIYCEVVEYNKPSISMVRNFGFIEEGRFTGHRFCDGGYQDILRFAIYRDGLGKIQQFVARLEKRNL